MTSSTYFKITPISPAAEMNKDQFYLYENDNWASISLVGFFPELEDVVKAGEGRPKRVKVPNPMKLNSERTLYDGRFYNISGTIEFKLNESYNPKTKSAPIQPSPTFPKNTPLWIETLDDIVEKLADIWERSF